MNENLNNNNNMSLWNAVEKTDPKHTKKAKIGGLSITAIAPQYQVMRATEQFGPYAVNWGFKNIELDFSLINSHKLVVFKGTFFCPDGECQIVNSAKIYMDRAEQMVDADFAKKMETDALTKVLSKMGFNADVFMGRYDDHKYVDQMAQEFAPKPPTQKEAVEKLGQAIDERALLSTMKSFPVDIQKNEDVLEYYKVKKAELTTTTKQ